MKNKKIKIELNSIFGKLEGDLALIEMYKVPLMVTYGKELSEKAIEEMKRIRKEKDSMNDINDFCLGFCMAGMFFAKTKNLLRHIKIE